MHFIRFLVYTFIGSFIWSAGLAYGGYQLGEHWEQIRAIMRPFDPFIFTTLVILVTWYILRHIKKSKLKVQMTSPVYSNASKITITAYDFFAI